MLFKGIELCCPHCRGDLEETRSEVRLGSPDLLRCAACARRFPALLGIPDLRVFADPYIDMEADRAKGQRVAERFSELSFAELLDYYYRITDVVPAKDAQRYKRGVLAAAARAEAVLDSWEGVGSTQPQRGLKLLEIGCGTGPLLAVAARRYGSAVGVDIAFRWLVVAKKRLAEAGLDVPLICACAEALPFGDCSFDRVAAESALEHVRDQQQTLTECHRVLRPGGRLLVTTPNKYSLGPDPQVGVWAGGYWPERWLAACVRRRGGIPPRRRLLSAMSLPRMLLRAGFQAPRLQPADVPEGQRRHFGRGMRLLIDGYRLARRFPVSRQLLQCVGPVLQAACEKAS